MFGDDSKVDSRGESGERVASDTGRLSAHVGGAG